MVQNPFKDLVAASIALHINISLLKSFKILFKLNVYFIL